MRVHQLLKLNASWLQCIYMQNHGIKAYRGDTIDFGEPRLSGELPDYWINDVSSLKVRISSGFH